MFFTGSCSATSESRSSVENVVRERGMFVEAEYAADARRRERKHGGSSLSVSNRIVVAKVGSANATFGIWPSSAFGSVDTLEFQERVLIPWYVFSGHQQGRRASLPTKLRR